MTKKVVWEKWKDPLLSNQQETEWPGYDLDEDGEKIPIHTPMQQPVIQTGFGMLSLMNDMSASSRFDFWVMHTNFDITEDFAFMIESLPGVETMEVYTRYRMRLGFPKSGLFKANEIMNNITELVKQLNIEKTKALLQGFDEDTAQNVVDMTAKMSEKYPVWALWVAPNGKCDVIGADTNDDIYNNHLQTLYSACDEVGGQVLTSEDR